MEIFEAAWQRKRRREIHKVMELELTETAKMKEVMKDVKVMKGKNVLKSEVKKELDTMIKEKSGK